MPCCWRFAERRETLQDTMLAAFRGDPRGYARYHLPAQKGERRGERQGETPYDFHFGESQEARRDTMLLALRRNGERI